MDNLKTQGISMPKLGLGTFRMQGDTCRAAVESALSIGYRHIDTAEMYGNEEPIGAALAAARLPRGELHVTTKVWHENLSPDAIRRSFDASLTKLRLDHVDLYLVHWPSKAANWGAVFETLMTLKQEGRTRAIGVANFTTALLKIAVEDIKAPIACNQIEYHALLDQSKVLAYLNAKSIPLVAYCPLAQGRIASDEVLAEIGAKHNACGAGRAEMAAGPGRCGRDPESLAPREPAGQSRRAEDHARRCRPQQDRRAAEGQALRQSRLRTGMGLRVDAGPHRRTLSPCGRGWLAAQRRDGCGVSLRAHICQFEFAEGYPSSGASRHLLPQGEKEEGTQRKWPREGPFPYCVAH